MSANAASHHLRSKFARASLNLFILLILFTSAFAAPAQAAGDLFPAPKGILATHSELDIDGDGVPNAIDNCVAVYNPMHNPYQPLPAYPNPQLDADQDGLGDPCDDNYENQVEPPPGYVDLSGGVGVFFADDNGEPLQFPDTNCFPSITLESTGFLPIIYNNYCVSISNNSPPYYFYRCSGFCAYDPSNDAKTTLISKITFQCPAGGSYVYDIQGNIFKMIALNTRCELVPQHLWPDTGDTDFDDDGVLNWMDDCPYEPGEAPNGCPVECHRRTSEWRAYVNTLGLENDLYYYETTVYYCFNDTYAEIKSARHYGNVDSGFDEAGLSLLGFTPKYRPDLSEVEYVDGASVGMEARFDMCFDVAVLIDKIGVKKTVEEKAFGFLSQKIATILAKYGDLSDPKGAQKLFESIDALGSRVLETADGAVAEAVPGPIGEYLQGKLDVKLAEEVESWQNEIKAALTGGAYTQLTADQLARLIVDSLIAELNGMTEPCFETWQPTHRFYVEPGGATISIPGDKFTNPFLSIEQIQ